MLIYASISTFKEKKMSNGFVKKTFKSFNSKQKLSYIVD